MHTEAIRTGVINKAKSFLGKPYKLGAKTGNTHIFDCSSLVQYVYGKYGIGLPRISRQQARRGKRVPLEELQPGDLIFYWSNRTRPGVVGHVAIYIDKGRILHAVPEEGVIISPFKRRDEDFQIYYMWSKRIIR